MYSTRALDFCTLYRSKHREGLCSLERHVLVLFPHPDDETLATGGAIALHAKAGSPITYACFTLGQMGRNMGKPFFANRETLPLIRERELREACKHLGISDLRLMGYRDKTLEFEDPAHLTQVIYDLIQEVKPSLIITYYPGYCVHPDHEAIAEATMRAVALLPQEARPRIHCQAFSQGHGEILGERDIVLDTSSVWEQVFAAMRAHRSQTALWTDALERDLQGTEEERTKVIERFSKQDMYSYTL